MAGTIELTIRWMGAKSRSSVHQARRHFFGSHGPETVSTRREHRDPSRIVEELRQEGGVESVRHVEVPFRVPPGLFR